MKEEEDNLALFFDQWSIHLERCSDCVNDVGYGRAYNMWDFMTRYHVPESYFDLCWEESEKIIRKIQAQRIADRLLNRPKIEANFYPGS